MAVEIRRILYSADEFKVIANLYVNLVGPSMGLAEGTVMAVDVIEDDPLEVRVHIQARDGRQIQHVFDKDNVVAAMTTFCSEMKIPLSKKSTKTAKKNSEGKFTFDMVIQSDMNAP
jgi:hypothetical protein